MTDPQGQAATIRLFVYGRSACHLCQDMLDALDALHGEYDFSLEFRDIDSNPDWSREYAMRIPVLAAGAKEICHYYLDPVAFHAYFSEQIE